MKAKRVVQQLKATRVGQQMKADSNRHQANRPGKSQARHKYLTIGQRNAKITIRFILVLTLGLVGLSLYSRFEQTKDSLSTLFDYANGTTSKEAALDPLSLDSFDADFELLSISPEGQTIGYFYQSNTGQAAIQLVSALSQEGWRQSGSFDDSTVSATDYATQSLTAGASLVRSSSVDSTERQGEPGLLEQTAQIGQITGPISILMEHPSSDGGVKQQMIIQLFPVSDGTSIVVTFF
jgi:hypothetical protein